MSDDDCVRDGAGSLILPHMLESPETSGTPQHGAKHTHKCSLAVTRAHNFPGDTSRSLKVKAEAKRSVG